MTFWTCRQEAVSFPPTVQERCHQLLPRSPSCQALASLHLAACASSSSAPCASMSCAPNRAPLSTAPASACARIRSIYAARLSCRQRTARSAAQITIRSRRCLLSRPIQTHGLTRVTSRATAASKDETQLVFLTQFPLDAKTFEDAFNDVWPTLQLDGTGRINKEQFFASGGLLELAQQKLLRHGAAGSGDRPGDGAADASSIGGSTSGGGGAGCGGGGAAAGPPIPDIMTERDAWFSRFDEDGAGLTQEEVVRGLIKTYRLGSDLEQVRSMRALVAEVWGIFAPSGPNARINRERFNLPHDGLADAIIANLDLSALPQQLSEDRALAAALAAENSSADTSAAPPPRDGAPSASPHLRCHSCQTISKRAQPAAYSWRRSPATTR